jgi:hypothetical protein
LFLCIRLFRLVFCKSLLVFYRSLLVFCRSLLRLVL